MSSSKNLIINCGAGHLTASVFSANGGKLLLERFTHIDLEYDLSQEDQWSSAVSDAVRSLPSGFKGAGPVSFILPGYQILTKAIKVPYVEEAKRAQVIAFEAQQQMPYPLPEVVWDYQVVSDDGVEIEVVIIAVKRQMIDEFCRRMAQDGFPPSQIAAASVLDYNAYQLAHGGDGENGLLIDIGARTTNLLFVGEQSSYIRNLSWGGNTLTQSIADSLGVSFAQADKLKVAFFSGQTRHSNDEKSTEALRLNAENFQKRLSQEVTRSIVNYRRQSSAAAPSRIFITGRGSQLPGLSEGLEAAQKVPVVIFDPVDAIQVGPQVDQTELEVFRTSMNSVVGLAAISVLGAKAYSVNLLPDELVQKMRVSRQKPFVLAAAALLVLATIPPYLFWTRDGGESAEDAAAFSAVAKPLQALHGEIQGLSKKGEAITKQMASLNGLVESRSNWIQFFADLQSRLEAVKDVWLEDLRLDRERDGQLAVSGRMLLRDYDPEKPQESYQAGFKRVNTLLESFEGSDFVEKVSGQQFNTDNPRILRFQFVLTLNPEKPL